MEDIVANQATEANRARINEIGGPRSTVAILDAVRAARETIESFLTYIDDQIQPSISVCLTPRIRIRTHCAL